MYDVKPPAPPVTPTPVADTTADIVVDNAVKQGEVMRIEQDNDISTTSDLPGLKAQNLLKSYNHKLIRVWIQLLYVYNKGNINYNYKYSSNVPVEDALTYYSACSDSLLVVLSGYNSTSTYPLPQGTAFKDFLRDMLVYYKQKFSKIKYVTVGNEPDHAGETMATYYPIYQNYYKAVNEANQLLNLKSDKILMSNAAFTGNVASMLSYANGFLSAYAADKNPDKKLNFFSFNSYGESDRPLELLDAKKKIDAAMKAKGLPTIPIAVTEYGMVGGTSLPSGLNLSQTIALQPAGQLTKAFYFYEGGINHVFNWCIHHGSIDYKSEIADIDNAYAYPYGHALTFCKEVSDRKTRLKAESDLIDSKGLGVHVLASGSTDKGIAVLVWNYNWSKSVADKNIKIRIKNLTKDIFKSGKIHKKIFVVDAKHNNYDYDKSQNKLIASVEENVDFSSSLILPLTLDRSAVALILLTPQ